jgi:hypothetical protein
MVKTINDERFFDFVKNLQLWVFKNFMDKEPLVIIFKIFFKIKKNWFQLF